jgi:hypothetical protein
MPDSTLFGAPGRIRTADPQIRSLVLPPDIGGRTQTFTLNKATFYQGFQAFVVT